MPELFDLLAGYGPDQIVRVRYDPGLGYPTQVSVDPMTDAIDDERCIEVSELAELTEPVD